MKEKRTYADRREYLIRAVSDRRRKLKAMAIEYKGDRCQICGYSRYQGALDLHHLDPREKDFALGQKGYARSWEKIKTELDKCILLCATCHREVEAGATQLPEGIQERKRGELLEALVERRVISSRAHVSEKVQRLSRKGVGRKSDRSTSHPIRQSAKDDDIVHPLWKHRDKV
jgi:hypothetical protein